MSNTRVLTLKNRISQVFVDQVSELLQLKGEYKVATNVQHFDHAIPAILNESEDLLLIPLDEVPLQYDDQICITSIMGRKDSQNCLVIHNKQESPNKHPLKNQELKVYVRYDYIQGVLIFLGFEGHSSRLDGYDKMIELLTNQADSGIILPKSVVSYYQNKLEDFRIIDLNIREFVPYPGAGCIAFICRKDDFKLRKALLKLHSIDLELRTNLERKFLKNLEVIGLDAGLHATRDDAGYFHFAYAAKSKKDYVLGSYSSSSTVGVMDYLLEKIY